MSATSIERALNTYENIIGTDQVATDTETVARCRIDGVTPVAVLFPKNPEQTSECMRVSAGYGFAVVPLGSGSKISMGMPPSRLELVISTARMNEILDLDTSNLTATAGAGARFAELQESLAGEENRCHPPRNDSGEQAGDPVCSSRIHKGCFVPISPPHLTEATLGGVIAADSWGPFSLLYGRPRDSVLGLRWVTANGDLIGTGGKTVKNVSGYDLCKLLVGSMGTLGILCEATLKLLPLPQCATTHVFPFDDLQQAIRFTERVLERPLLPAAAEILNQRAAHAVWNDLGVNRTGFFVAVALEGFEEPVNRMSSEILQVTHALGGAAHIQLEGASHKRFWQSHSQLARNLAGYWPQMIALRLNFPLSVWGRIFRRSTAILREHGLKHALSFHAGCGLARIYVNGGALADESTHRTAPLARSLLRECRSVGGNMVVEHAPSAAKRYLPVWGARRGDLFLMEHLKKQMDPMGILCPGRYMGGI